MSKDAKFDFDTNWYDLWMKQSREFFETANENLQTLFENGAFINPEAHMAQINLWVQHLKSQWQIDQFQEKQQKAYEKYWKTMGKMCSDACDMMVDLWIKRARDQNPIRNIRELYELWLNCCNDIYKKSMHSKSYQDVYGEFMNAALKFWKSAIPE